MSKSPKVSNVQIQKQNSSKPSAPINRIQSKQPADLLLDLLRPMKKAVRSDHEKFDKSIETLEQIVKNIASSFENDKFRTIKKKNKKYQKDLAWFKEIDSLMIFFGFRDQGESWVFVEELGKSHAQMRVIDLSIACKKLNDV